MSFRSLARRLRSDIRGAAQPFLVIGSVVVFGIVATGLAGGLQVAMQTMQSSKVNTALSAAVSDLAQRTATNGYTAAQEISGSEPVSVSVGATTVTGLRTVTVDEDSRTAKITIMAGKYAHGSWTDPYTCVEDPAGCMTATTTATPGLSQSIPKPAGLTMAQAGDNEIDVRETRWIDIAVGSKHVVAIDGEGALWSWGTGRALGAGAELSRLYPQRISFTAKFVDVAATDYASFAIDDTGRLLSWGETDAGALARAGAAADGVPTVVPGEQRWVSVEAGSRSVCALTADAELYCWGYDVRTSATNYTSTVTRITIPGETDLGFADVSVGDRHWIAATTSGAVYTWGRNDLGQLGVSGPAFVARTAPVKVETGDTDTSALTGAHIVEVEAGRGNSYAVDQLGRTWGWGLNSAGQVGSGVKGTAVFEPVRVGANSSAARVEAFAGNGAFQVTRAGGLLAWGKGNTALYGVASDQLEPTKIQLLTPTENKPEAAFLNAYSPTVSSNFIYVLDSTHRLWLWGTGIPEGMSGDGTAGTKTIATPQQLQMRQPSTGLSAKDVALTETTASSLGTDGTVYTWPADAEVPQPKAVEIPTSIDAQVTAAFADDESAYLATGGLANMGQSSTSAARIGSIAPKGDNRAWISAEGRGNLDYQCAFSSLGDIVDVSAAEDYIAAVQSTGKVIIVGKNPPAGTGVTAADGECVSSSNRVSSITGANDVAATNGMLAVLSGTTLSLYGENLQNNTVRDVTSIDSGSTSIAWVNDRNEAFFRGKLGNMDAGRYNVQMTFAMESDVVDIAVGANHMLFLTADGRVGALNFTGVKNDQDENDRLGFEADGPSAYPAFTMTEPTRLIDGKKVVSIDAGDDTSAYVTEDGAVYRSGAGYDGLERKDITVTAQVPAFGTATAIEGNGTHLYAISGGTYLWEIVNGTYTPVVGAPSGVEKVASGGDGSLVVETKEGGVWFRDSHALFFQRVMAPRKPDSIAAATGTFAVHYGADVYFWGDVTRTPFASAGDEGTGRIIAPKKVTFPKAVDAVMLGSGYGLAAGWSGLANHIYSFGARNAYTGIQSSLAEMTIGDATIKAYDKPRSAGGADLSMFSSMSVGENAGDFSYVQASKSTDGVNHVSVTAGFQYQADGTAKTSFLTAGLDVGVEAMVRVDASKHNVIGVSDAGFVWQTFDGQLLRLEATDPSADWVLSPVATPQVVQTRWLAAKIPDMTQVEGRFQVNIRTDLPVAKATLACTIGGEEYDFGALGSLVGGSTTEVTPSSGNFSFVNIDTAGYFKLLREASEAGTEDVSGWTCEVRVLINGWAASSAEVSTVIVPTIDADGIPEGWD